MNRTEYLKIKDAGTALVVRLAVTCGWAHVRCLLGRWVSVWQEDPDKSWLDFNPFTDASIPYGLIGRGVDAVGCYYLGFYATPLGASKCVGAEVTHESKTHAIINAFCQADPMGHWAAFTNGNKQAALAEAAIKVAAQVGGLKMKEAL